MKDERIDAVRWCKVKLVDIRWDAKKNRLKFDAIKGVRVRLGFTVRYNN